MSSLLSVRSRLGASTGALVMLTPLSQLGFVPVSVVLGEELGIGPASIGLAVGLYAVSAAAGTVLLGPLFDLVPARKILPWAILVNLAVSLGFIWVPNFSVLVVGRLLAGFANSALALAASVIVADTFRDSPSDRDKAFSGLQTFVSTGAISGLTLGGLCAGLGMPWLFFAVVAGYGVFVLCMLPVILKRMKRYEFVQNDDLDETNVSDEQRKVGTRPTPAALLVEIIRMVRSPRTILLLLATVCGSWVLQGGHYSLSMLLNAESVNVAARTALTVVIPIGVLAGALVNQWSLMRVPVTGIYARAFLVLPLACGGLALAITTDHMLAWAGGLFCVGIVCGMLGPLQPTLIVGWYPDMRGSASAAVNVANSAGAALGPIVMGAIAMYWVLPGVVGVAAGVAAIGAILAVFLSRSLARTRSTTPAMTPVAAGER